jgi:methanogenic corrinoid protein MtbC1
MAEAIAASESSIKRWVDSGRIRAEKSDGGHRHIPIGEAIRFIRDAKKPLQNGGILGFPDIDAVLGQDLDRGADAENLFAYLAAGQEEKARGFILLLYMRGDSVASILDGPIRESMSKIGELWRSDQTGIYVEHLASEICVQAVYQIQSILQPPRDAPLALGGGAPDDPSILPTLGASCALLAEGYRTINIGANTPLETLAQAVQIHRPILVWCSINHGKNLKGLSAGFEHLAETTRLHGAHLIIGGRNLRQRIKTPPENVYLGESMSELAAFARGLKLLANKNG